MCTGTCLLLSLAQLLLTVWYQEECFTFPRIQMANCTRPPALNDKWKKSTFHPSPSLPLGCTLIFLLKVWWKEQLDVWIQAALERVWYRIILFNSSPAYRCYLCFWCSQDGVEKKTSQLTWQNASASERISCILLLWLWVNEKLQIHFVLKYSSVKFKGLLVLSYKVLEEEQVCNPNTSVP